MKRILISLIEKYQKKGGGEALFGIECNFIPSCSEYTKQAIEKYGAIKGAVLGLKRIKRCNNRDATEKVVDNLK
ncbi:MAG: membrane protein insertion efficiency factor YidD [Bacteroidales bacterium]